MPRPIARWNPARDVWETETTGLFCEHSDVFSETWPSSGTTRTGTACELPTWERRTGGSASSSSPLLQTPQAQDERHSLANSQNRADSGRQMQLTHVIGMLAPED